MDWAAALPAVATISVSAPEAYGAMIDRELKLWGDVVQETGVRVKA